MYTVNMHREKKRKKNMMFSLLFLSFVTKRASLIEFCEKETFSNDVYACADQKI